MIRRLLVANRGEIACRIFRTARRLGIKCVAVHSAADENAEHVRQADESWYLGPAPAAESYLNMDRILQLAERSIDAIHPGYGFLSENPEFATRVLKAGITFVGPPPDAMRAVGDKRTARLRMKKIGIPVVPGEEKVRTVAEFRTAARRIGYPVLVKAAAGGGGRGMRRVDTPDELSSALHAARHEAKAAFGDGRLLLEHCVESARHIEVQIFADSQGGIVHLFERDCSLQRRHQKIIEEAPAPGLDEDLTLQLREAALRVAREVGYVGAGTVEFLVPRDGPDPFYFLEMNARLQVEHTVTEEITGEDLVEWQLRVAAGETLPRTQEELAVTGHAIQARLCAEDPSDDFRPSPKPLRRLVLPEPGPGLRIDSGVVEGSAIPPDYDSLVAKIVASGPNRDAARGRLYRALRSIHVTGPATNRNMLLSLIRSHMFATTGSKEKNEGTDTALMDRLSARYFSEGKGHEPRLLAAAGLHVHLVNAAGQRRRRAATSDPHSPFADSDGWAMCGFKASHPVKIRHGYKFWSVILWTSFDDPEDWYAEVCPAPPYGTFTMPYLCMLRAVPGSGDGIDIGGENGNPRLEEIPGDGRGFLSAHAGMFTQSTLQIRVFADGRLTPEPGELLPGGIETARVFADGPHLEVEYERAYGDELWQMEFIPHAVTDGDRADTEAGCRAPLPGRVLRCRVKPGDKVIEGAELVTIEAMKTEHVLRAPTSGTVSAVYCAVGDTIEEGVELLAFEADKTE